MNSKLGQVMKMKQALEQLSRSETSRTDEIMDILMTLSTCSVTLDLLQRSGIGITVNRIRKEVQDTQVVAQVKKLMRSWKKLLPDVSSSPQAHTSPNLNATSRNSHLTSKNSHLADRKFVTPKCSRLKSSKPNVKLRKPRPIVQPYVAPPAVTPSATPLSPAIPPSSSVAHLPPIAPLPPTPTTPPPPSPVPSASSPSTLPASSLPDLPGTAQKLPSSVKPSVAISLNFKAGVSGRDCTPSTGSDVRDRCRELLVKALKKDCEKVSIEEEYKFYNLSSQIEQFVFESLGDTGSKYKQRVRSRVSNLGDAKNLVLRQQVIAGLISPAEIATMTADEMASDSMKELRQKLTQEAIRDAQVAEADGAGGENCGLLQCPECSKNKCSYTQAQILCSDEPMTTFAYCHNCGNRWTFD